MNDDFDDDNEDTIKKRKKGKPKTKLIKFQIPESQKRELVRYKTLDEVWPLVLAYVVENPDKAGDNDLWSTFRNVLRCEFATFKQDIRDRGIAKLRGTVKGHNKESKKKKPGTKQGSLQLTEAVQESFDKKRQRKALLHLGRMDVILDDATKILEQEGKGLQKMKPEKAAIFLESHLDKATKIHSLASKVYAIDAESKEDKSKKNLAILMSFDPHSAVIEVKQSDGDSSGVSSNSERCVKGQVIEPHPLSQSESSSE